jgi:DNA-binding Xre family transcriptional regulator
MAIHKLSVKERIESRIVSKDNCWLTAYTHSKGRPEISINGKSHILSRVVYEVYKGKHPGNLFVCHSCDNPLCINPDHLWLGTAADNRLDCKKKNRQAKGSTMGNSKLTEVQVSEIRDLLAKKEFSHKQIGQRFGVSGRTVSSINAGTTWTHVEGIGSQIAVERVTTKLDVEKVKQIKRLILEGMGTTKISNLFGVTKQTISCIKFGKIWKRVTLD